jgi:hypothetical protein
MAVHESKETKERCAKYVRVFGTLDGREVLKEILLSDLKVFSTISQSDVGAIALRNHGIELMYRLGMAVDQNVERLLDNALTLR